MRVETRLTQVRTPSEVLKAFLDEKKAPYAVLAAWETLVQNGARKGPSLGEVGGVAELKSEVRELSKMVKSLVTTQPKPTYSSVAANKSPGLLIVPERRVRETLVVPGTESEEMRTKTGAALVEEINKNTVGNSARAARRLNSGQVVVSFETEQERKRWEFGGEAQKIFGQAASIKSRDYTVIVPNMPLNKLSGDKEEVIRGLYAQNPSWAGKVEITRVNYAAKSRDTNKRSAPLFIGVKEPSQANVACQKGLVCDGELFDVEVYAEGCRVLRCYNCQEYAKHVAKFCKSPPRCGFCAGVGHTTRECPKYGDRYAERCVPCGNRKGHTAFSKGCPKYVAQADQARTNFLSRPTRYQVGAEAEPPRSSFDFRQSSEAEFTVVKPRKRRAVGDQTGSADIRQVFASVPRGTFGVSAPEATPMCLSGDDEAVPQTQLTHLTYE